MDGLSSLFCSLSLLSALFCVFSPWCRPRFLGAAMFCFILVVIRGTNEKSEGEGGSLGAGVLTSSPLPFVPSFPPLHSISALHLSIFLSDSWQPVGYSGHASLPRCIHLPKDLRKHVLVHAALLDLGGWSWRGSHYRPRSMAAVKHATVCPQKMNPLGDTWGQGHTIKPTI